MIASRFENIKARVVSWWESLACWWDWRGGVEGIWDDLVSPIRWKWESFKMWRRRRNPELVELDAYRELVFLERKLKEYPSAIPLLEAALRDYETTGQKGKMRDVMRRLREADPQSKSLEEMESKPKEAVLPETEGLVARAMELVRNGERASPGNFQRKLGIGYNQAAQVWEILEARGLIETEDVKRGTVPTFITFANYKFSVFENNATQGEDALATCEGVLL